MVFPSSAISYTHGRFLDWHVLHLGLTPSHCKYNSRVRPDFSTFGCWKSLPDLRFPLPTTLTCDRCYFSSRSSKGVCSGDRRMVLRPQASKRSSKSLLRSKRSFMSQVCRGKWPKNKCGRLWRVGLSWCFLRIPRLWGVLTIQLLA